MPTPLRLTPLLLAACGCPKPLCTQWLVVQLPSDDWRVGIYELEIDVAEARLRCALRVVTDGTAPTPRDTTCEPGTVRETPMLDTASLDDPLDVELRHPVGSGPDVPLAASVRLVWTSDGQRAALVDEDVVLAWDERRSPTGTCAAGCFTARLVVPVPLARS